jgi:hypothetical protein
MDDLTISETSQKSNELRERSSNPVTWSETPTREPVSRLFGELSGISGNVLDAWGANHQTHLTASEGER